LEPKISMFSACKFIFINLLAKKNSAVVFEKTKQKLSLLDLQTDHKVTPINSFENKQKKINKCLIPFLNSKAKSEFPLGSDFYSCYAMVSSNQFNILFGKKLEKIIKPRVNTMFASLKDIIQEPAFNYSYTQ